MTDVVSRGPGAQASSEDRIIAGVNYGLLFATLLSGGLTTLVAPVLAYVRRPLSDPVTRTHFAFQLRIFWIGLVVFVLCVIAAIIGLLMTFGVLGPEDARGIANLFTVSDGQSSTSVSGHFNAGGVIVMIVAGLALIADVIWIMLASVFGLARLLSSEPIGRVK
jgi:uncharacterized membrane protein